MGRQRVARRAWLAASCCITVALVGSMPDESENVGRERSSTMHVNSVAEVWGELSTALVEFDPTSAYSNPFDLRERLFTFGAMTVRHTHWDRPASPRSHPSSAGQDPAALARTISRGSRLGRRVRARQFLAEWPRVVLSAPRAIGAEPTRGTLCLASRATSAACPDRTRLAASARRDERAASLNLSRHRGSARRPTGSV